MKYINANKGIYVCNGKHFFSKLEAALESKKTGKQIHWYFYEDAFSKYDWTKPSSLDINELYKQRAIQLRNQYDHLVLFYSGGVDSGYILKIFMDNDIKIDEIFIFGSFDLESKKYKTLGYDKTPGYYSREVEWIAKPVIKEVVKKWGTKVTEYDWTEDIIDETNNIDWFWHSGSRFSPDQMVRSKFHTKFREHNDYIDKGKNVGFIYGVDKPKLVRDDKSIYFQFLDLTLTTGTNNQNDMFGHTWENDEFFYWTPNFPEIIIKQSHMVVDYLKMNNKLNLIRYINQHKFHDTDYYDVANRVVYPDWNHNLWQIKKVTNQVVGHQLCDWFYEDKTTNYYRKWESSLYELQNQLGGDFFNDNSVLSGLKGHVSKLYKICDI